MKLKSFLVALFGATSIGVQAEAVAQGMPVIDVANVTQAIKQVAAWEQQAVQMRQQITALTGPRGMATLLPALAPVLPADWHQAMTDLSPLAQQLRAAQAVLTPSQLAALPAPMRDFVTQAGKLSAANQALAQSAYNDAAMRQARLTTMTGALASSQDPKAAYDLANAIAIEHAGLLHDQNQLLAASNGAAAQMQAQQRMINEMRSASAGTGNFPKFDTSLP